MESTAGFEPADNSFADCRVDRFTTSMSWLVMPAARLELASNDLKGRRSTVELRRHELREDGVEPPRDLNQTQMPYRLGYSRSMDSPARIELAASRLGNARSFR